MNSYAEEKLIEQFIKNYTSFPEGSILKSERHVSAADYILTTTTGERIGIELTEAFNSTIAKRLSSQKREFTDLVLGKLKGKMPFTFSITIDIHPEIGISKAKRNDIAEAVASFSIDEFACLENHQFGEVTNIDINLHDINYARMKPTLLARGYRNLPPRIESIVMTRFDGISESWNSQGEGGVIPNFTIEFLKPILKRKEDKLSKYLACDQFWLIIKEGNYVAGSFNDIQLPLPIDSSYNKVFIFRTLEQKVVELK